MKEIKNRAPSHLFVVDGPMTDSDEKSMAADIPEEDRHMISLFLSKKSKERFTCALSERDRTHIAQVILYIMTISEHALEEVKETECFKSALALANSSIDRKAISPDLEAIFETNKDKLRQEIDNDLDALKAKLLGRHKRDYDRLLSMERTDCAERMLAGARKKRRNSDYIETYKNLQRAYGELKRGVFSLSLDLLGGTLSGKSMAPYVSFLVCNPERLAFSLIFTKPEWGTFPMKWASLRLPVSTLYDLLNEHRRGQDVSRIFLEKYAVEDGFSNLRQAAKNLSLRHALGKRIAERLPLIEEIVHAYTKKLFGACIFSSLPLIEGLLWAFAEYLDRLGKSVFCNGDKTVLNLKNGNTIWNPKIRQVVEFSSVADYLDSEFVFHFVEELYDERNSMLHGRVVPELSALNAARKVAVIEYLLETIAMVHEELFLEHMDKNIDEKTISRMLDSVGKNFIRGNSGDTLPNY